jgi:hypothetical protein
LAPSLAVLVHKIAFLLSRKLVKRIFQKKKKKIGMSLAAEGNTINQLHAWIAQVHTITRTHRGGLDGIAIRRRSREPETGD